MTTAAECTVPGSCTIGGRALELAEAEGGGETTTLEADGEGPASEETSGLEEQAEDKRMKTNEKNGAFIKNLGTLPDLGEPQQQEYVEQS
jgi:hypothetical protein